VRLPIDAGTAKFSAAGPDESVLYHETRAWKLDENGAALFKVPLSAACPAGESHADEPRQRTNVRNSSFADGCAVVGSLLLGNGDPMKSRSRTSTNRTTIQIVPTRRSGSSRE
jgi:hypothetical protein